MAELLLKNGAEVAIKDAKGKTALDHAKDQGMESLIKLLETY